MPAYSMFPYDSRGDLLSHQSDLRKVFATEANRLLEELEAISPEKTELRRSRMREYFSLHEWIDEEDQKIDNLLRSIDFH